MKGLFSCLVSVALLPPCAIILEIKSEALGTKSLVLREHLVIRGSSENIGPEETLDGILLDKWGIRTIIMETYPFCQRVYIKKQSSILMSRSKNEVGFPWRSTLRSNSLG